MTFFDPKHLIDTFGLVGLLAVIFIESGLFPAPLPGDSLLFTAGLFAADHNKYGLHIVTITAGALVCAIVGAQIGYEIGERFGTRLFKPGARFFKPEYEARSHEFFERQGPKAIILARFIPVVRTVAPMLAGVSEMRRRTFLVYNVAGAALWAVGISLAGFYLGKHIKNVDRYLLPIVAVIVLVSLIPPALEYRKHRRRQAEDATKP
ncbi:MAG: rane-associated protein [Actinomycetota bacterium]|nr:rane-associated protein [Actinomycetota bacterium]